MNLLYDNASQHPSGYRDIDPIHVAHARGKVRVIDVREPASSPASSVMRSAPSSFRSVRSRPLRRHVLVCRSGGRSARAATLLASMGFRHPMNMVGGMIAWNDARLAVER